MSDKMDDDEVIGSSDDSIANNAVNDCIASGSGDVKNNVKNNNKIPFSEIIDVSSGEEEEDYNYVMPPHKTNSQFMSFMESRRRERRDSEDDICIIEHKKYEPESEDTNNSGSHTNDELNVPDSEGRVLVNVAHPPEDPNIYLAPQIARNVKPHQIGGIRFLYDCTVGSLKKSESAGSGCILSHSMGLGKTLQIISFVDVFLRHTNAKRVLCIVPINTLQNWIAEFAMWLPEEGSLDKWLNLNKSHNNDGEVVSRSFKVYALNEAKDFLSRSKEIFKWKDSGGVLLMGYEIYRILTTANNVKRKKSYDMTPETLNQIQNGLREALVDPGPDLVVCDEGHRIKNYKAATSQSLKNIKTRRRIVLTGYPLQNNLIEYWCMVDFVRPQYLGRLSDFGSLFEKPICVGLLKDATDGQKRLMRYRSHTLYGLLKGFVQRRSHVVLKNALPVKNEYVIKCRLSDIQKKLMLQFLNVSLNDPNNLGIANGKMNILVLFAVCCKIWNHPDIIYDMVREGKTGYDDLDIDFTDKKKPNNRKKKTKTETEEAVEVISTDMSSYMQQFESAFDCTPLRTRNDNVIDYSWANDIMENYMPGNIENSNKMVILFEIIEETIKSGDRLLLFSQSLFTLDLIERYLKCRYVPNTESKWSKNVNYYRLDGSTSTQEREKYINQFNNKSYAYLFLVSTRAGSLGINLIGANRIIIYDASWNPCHDAQAACRIYRYGQTKPCYIYRLICDDSLEKKIYDRQVSKQGMANRVVDEQNIEAMFKASEIRDLIKDLNKMSDNPIKQFGDEELAKFEDRIIRHVCIKLFRCINALPFEHESLLLDRKELKLTASEKRYAQQSYDTDKQRHTSNNIGLMLSNARMLDMQLQTSVNSFAYPSSYSQPTYNNCLPPYSQPLPPYVQHSHSSAHISSPDTITQLLMQRGGASRKCIVNMDIEVDLNTGNKITLKRGETVVVLQSPDSPSEYLMTYDGKLVPINNQNKSKVLSALSFPPNTSFMPSSFGIVQPNLQCGGTVLTSGFASHTSTRSSNPPEVVLLSDDEEETQNSTSDIGSNETPANNNGETHLTNKTIVIDSSTSSSFSVNDILSRDSASTAMSYLTADNPFDHSSQVPTEVNGFGDQSNIEESDRLFNEILESANELPNLENLLPIASTPNERRVNPSSSDTSYTSPIPYVSLNALLSASIDN